MAKDISHTDSLDIILREVVAIRESGDYYELALDGFPEDILIPKGSPDVMKDIKPRTKESPGSHVLMVYRNGNRCELFYGPVDPSKIYDPRS